MAKSTFRLVLAWMIWTLATLTYFHQYYLRMTVSSLSNYLMHDFFLTIVDLTDLAVLFFIAYVITLPIAGVLLDRYGVKKMLPLASLVTAVSCFLFSDSQSVMELVIARILMGASASFSLLAALSVIRKNFRAGLFPVLSGLTLTIGLVGGIFGGWFLIDESRVESWRLLMQYAGWISLVIAILFFLSVHHQEKKERSQHQAGRATLKTFINDVILFLDKWQSWLPGIYGGFILTPIVAFASFWSTPFLSLHYHVSTIYASFLTSIILVGYAVGAPIIALLAQKFGLRLIMLLFAIDAAVSMALLSHGALPLPMVIVFLFLLGFSAGAFALTTILIKLITPEDISASAFSFNTMLSQLIGAFILWIIGQCIFYWHGVKIIQNTQSYSYVVLQHSMDILVVASCLGILVACAIRAPRNVGFKD